MYHTKVLSTINFKELLQNINQEDAFTWFLNEDISGYFRNPYRDDSKPGCYLEWSGDLLLMWDWGDSNFKGKSILQVISYVHNLNYRDAAKYLYNNFVLNRTMNKPSHTRTIREKGTFKKLIFPTSRAWRLEDKEYWSQYYISKADLELDKIIPISWYYTNSSKNPEEFFPIRPKHPTYGIPIQDRWKIYTPIGKVFDTNQQWYDIGGLQPFNDDSYIIITKSFKDYRVLATQGYNARYILCETVRINPKFLKYITKEFKRVYYLMDNDIEGIKACERLVMESEEITGLKIFKGIYYPVHLPKDSADVIKQFGESSFNHILEELLI
jgi:hypothetical protein